jgi:hypothetical protein
MVNRVQTLRSSTAGNRPAAGTRAPGELYSNWPDKQLGVIDASQNPMDLIAVRFFSSTAAYATGDFVLQAGQLYQAKSTLAAGAFNASNWNKVTVANDILTGNVAKAGDTMTGPLVLPADPTTNLQAATKQYADTKLPLAGGTLTGALTLAADPVSALQAATKQYADSLGGAIAKVSSGNVTTPVSFIAFPNMTGYRSYKLILKHCEPSASLLRLQTRFSKDNGATWISANGSYGYAGVWIHSGAAAGATVGMWGATADGQSSGIVLAGQPQANATGNGFGYWEIDIDPGSASAVGGIQFRTANIQGSGGTLHYAAGSGFCGSFGPLTNLEIFYSTGNINKCEWELYGYSG